MSDAKPHSVRPEIEEALAAVRRVGTEEAMVAGVLLRHEIIGLVEQLETLRRGAEWEEEHGGCFCRPCNELIGGSNPASTPPPASSPTKSDSPYVPRHSNQDTKDEA